MTQSVHSPFPQPHVWKEISSRCTTFLIKVCLQQEDRLYLQTARWRTDLFRKFRCLDWGRGHWPLIHACIGYKRRHTFPKMGYTLFLTKAIPSCAAFMCTWAIIDIAWDEATLCSTHINPVEGQSLMTLLRSVFQAMLQFTLCPSFSLMLLTFLFCSIV